MRGFPLRAWALIALLTPPIAASAYIADGHLPGWGPVLLWIALLGLAELMPITLGLGSVVTMSVPIHLALALIFPPWVAMAITGLAALDIREFRGELSLERSLFNRAQIMLAVGGAAAVFSMNPGSDFRPLPVLGAALAHLLINLGLVSLAVSSDEKVSLRDALRTMIPGPVAGFALSYMALSALGAVSAKAYERFGEWAVAAILIPLLFARLSVLGARAQQELTERVQAQQKALLEATQRVFEERETERHRITEHIHDTSLQLLAAVAFACENALTHLDAGRDEDVRTTIKMSREATDQAIRSLRDSLVDLRRSAVEEGGLMETVRNFTQQVETLWGVKVDLRGELPTEPPIPVALGAVQILQEGLMNSVKHGHADWVFVWVGERNGTIRLIVEDKGAGFDPKAPIGAEHAGVRMMTERAEKLGGHVDIHSQPGSGTRLEAILPSGVSS